MSAVSCIMPTAGRRKFVPAAIRLFLAQDYADKELVIVDDGADRVEDIVPPHPQIKYVSLPDRLPLGSKRNLACEVAKGDIIVHWDDDDWHAPWRLRYQVEALKSGNLDVCGVDRVFFVNAEIAQAWEYVHPPGPSQWVCGATLCYSKTFWENHRFADINRGEDSRFIFSARGARVGVLGDNGFLVARIHAANSCPKRPRDARWQPCSINVVRSLVGSDWEDCFGGEGGLPLPAVTHKIGTALISAASGIGDILRVTPLIRAAHRLGYEVDVLLWPDDSATAELLRGAREIRRLFVHQNLRTAGGPRSSAGPTERPYDVATFTRLSVPLSQRVQAGRRYTFDSSWRTEGDVANIERIARALGWQGDLPVPFAVKSTRRFGLPRDTIALHPGCKPNWPWKKWHGFDELAERFTNVAIVGTAADLDNHRTYFGRAFDWPDHVNDFVGKLDLRDTAALMSQCAALVSLDSGLMHLGVALGVPTFGIFGITNPERECIRSPLMIPVTKGMPCESACRRAVWGRRDCDQHLECLKTLNAEEVAGRVTALLPELATRSARGASSSKSDSALSLNYHGEVFHASGYGQAARAYVHALHAAGVQVHVINTGRKPYHVEDQTVAALLGHDPHADFNLFHGIPSFWASRAYREHNVIAMTVWEADRMPQAWRNPLNHAIDIWLPCTFNADLFAHELGKTPFRLPHALLPAEQSATLACGEAHLGIEPKDFVFYSIFEWQDRKNPRGLIEAYLTAFPTESDVLLLIKTSAGVANEAEHLLREVRAETQSLGRVALRCEMFDEAHIQALHARGDAYVSLHRGEGWGYPLFEAASRGKPIVATAYGGPVDYLDSTRHWLVRHKISPVGRPYFLYSESMNWAEPDLSHAREGLQWVCEHRVETRAAAEEAAGELRETFSLERIGQAAKARLITLQRASSRRASVLAPQPQRSRAPAALPIPGDWYDADYFERGLKSNWARGYAWQSFQGIFRETAGLLHETFPEATSYVDAGCAKGFLVQSLRERGLDARGFDHSTWAIGHAQAGMRPFLELAGADTVTYDGCSVDVLVAMSLLESLTEDQIKRFLPRARAWVRRGCFVTIPAATGGADRDLSHITMHDCQWWYERFLESGWRRDPLQQTIEQHPLPKRMKWIAYVFEPER
jgi:glycosyltransferase involved in cell wall biosynthesis